MFDGIGIPLSSFRSWTAQNGTDIADVLFSLHSLVFTEGTECTREKTRIRTILEILEKGIVIDRFVIVVRFRSTEMMSKHGCNAWSTSASERFSPFQEWINVFHMDRNIELIQSGNQLMLRDRMCLSGIQVLEDCFQAEIAFVDLDDNPQSTGSVPSSKRSLTFRSRNGKNSSASFNWLTIFRWFCTKLRNFVLSSLVNPWTFSDASPCALVSYRGASRALGGGAVCFNARSSS